jgi:hypothetical protein
MKVADQLNYIHEKKIGDWKLSKEFEKFGGNYINHTYKHKKSDAEVHFIKDNVLEPTVKGKILLIIPSKKVNKELEWATSKDKSFFNDAEIKAGLKKADKELNKMSESFKNQIMVHNAHLFEKELYALWKKMGTGNFKKTGGNIGFELKKPSDLKQVVELLKKIDKNKNTYIQMGSSLSNIVWDSKKPDVIKEKKEEDGLQRLLKRVKKSSIAKEKDKEIFIVAEQTGEDVKSEAQEIFSDFRKEIGAETLAATTDTEYAKDGFVTDGDDWDESSDTHYYAMYARAPKKHIEMAIKKLDKKYGFYGAWIGSKQVKTW